MAQSDHIRNQRLQKLQELRDQGLDPFYNRFVPTHTIAEILGEFGGLSGEELEALQEKTISQEYQIRNLESRVRQESF